MKRKNEESQAVPRKRKSLAIQDPGIASFPGRLAQITKASSIRGVARKALLSEGVFHSYLAGETYPTLDRLDQIAAAAGRPPAWFIGVDVGPESAPQPATALDERALRFALEMVENVALLLGSKDPTWLRADLIARVYELLVKSPDQPAAMIDALQLVRTTLAPTPPDAPAPASAEPSQPTLHKFGPWK